MPQPTLIIVTGLPCTGKSTLARGLAERLGMPMLGKDQVKEILFDTLGTGDRPWSRRLGVASTAVLLSAIESLLAAGVSCVAESNFHPELDAPRLLDLRRRHPFAAAQVLCVADGQVLLERYRRRAERAERHPGHLDHILLDELRPQLLGGRLAPLDLGGPLVEVDTTDLAAVDVDAVAGRVVAALAGHSGGDGVTG